MGIVLQFVLPILVVVGLYLAIYIRLRDRPPVSSYSLTLNFGITCLRHQRKLIGRKIFILHCFNIFLESAHRDEAAPTADEHDDPADLHHLLPLVAPPQRPLHHPRVQVHSLLFILTLDDQLRVTFSLESKAADAAANNVMTKFTLW